MKKGDLKQEEILNFLINYLDNNPYPPSYREIAKGVNIKVVSGNHHTLIVSEQM